MPRYGGQYDPREMQQTAGGNPFYNPMQPTADWSQGIRSILNGMWAYKEQRRKEDEAKKKWEAEFGVKQQEATANIAEGKARSAYYDRGNRPTQSEETDITPDMIQPLADLFKIPAKTVQSFMKLPKTDRVAIYRNLTERMLYDNRDQAAEAKANAKEQAEQIKADSTLLAGATQYLGKYKMSIDANKEMDEAQKITAKDAITRAMGRIGGYRTSFLTNRRPLGEQIRSNINAIIADPSALASGDWTSILESEGGNTPSPAMPTQSTQSPSQPTGKPPSKTAIWSPKLGKWLEKNQDGTFRDA
jgi:hypothetical protein